MSLPGFTGERSEYKTVRSYSANNELVSTVIAQGWFDWIPDINPGTFLPGGCTYRCVKKKGFGACVARCQIDNKACDNGQNNCS
mgnify:CR=1 FL=1